MSRLLTLLLEASYELMFGPVDDGVKDVDLAGLQEVRLQHLGQRSLVEAV